MKVREIITKAIADSGVDQNKAEAAADKVLKDLFDQIYVSESQLDGLDAGDWRICDGYCHED